MKHLKYFFTGLCLLLLPIIILVLVTTIGALIIHYTGISDEFIGPVTLLILIGAAYSYAVGHKFYN